MEQKVLDPFSANEVSFFDKNRLKCILINIYNVVDILMAFILLLIVANHSHRWNGIPIIFPRVIS